MNVPPVVFFGYPYDETLRKEAIVGAAKQLTTTSQISAQLWEDLKINGQFVINPILEAIDRADISAFDVTELNHNVMFELGFAIGKDRRIWLLRDETHVAAQHDWNKVKVLTTVGYSKFSNPC